MFSPCLHCNSQYRDKHGERFLGLDPQPDGGHDKEKGESDRFHENRFYKCHQDFPSSAPPFTNKTDRK